MIEIAWLSGAGFRIVDSMGNVIFIDAWLDAPPGNPGRPLSVGDVKRADLVLVTHGDPGHYGRGDGVRIAAQNRCPFASSPELCSYVLASGLIPADKVRPLPMNEAATIGAARVQMFPAVHPPWVPPAGYPVPRDPNAGFLLTIEGSTVLFVGDAVAGDAIYSTVSAGRSPIVGLLPIGSPAGSHGTLESTADLAAGIAAMSGMRYVIPHYNFVANNPVLPSLRAKLAAVGAELLDLAPGKAAQFENGSSRRL
ncbi:MAG TPA: MBL fold metallo-hydrolase [Xanthobacteraceae bacterium]|nr:MBL fold metallo-hydrolase [Xanthobacteraceae bacterium]